MSSAEDAQKQLELLKETERLKESLLWLFYSTEALRYVLSPFLERADLFPDSGKMSFERIAKTNDAGISWYVAIDLFAGAGRAIAFPTGGTFGIAMDMYFECFVGLVRATSEQKFRIDGNSLTAGNLDEDLRTALTRYADGATIGYLARAATGGLRESLRSFIRSGFDKKFKDAAPFNVHDVVQQLFWTTDYIASSSIGFLQTFRQHLAKERALQKFHCLTFDIAQRLKKTTSIAKSRTLQSIREDLERQSKEIVAEVNR